MTTERDPGDAEAILDLNGLEAICDAIAEGVTLRRLCEAMGVERGSLRRWVALDKARQQQFEQARIDAASAFEELADEELEHAADPFELAKAKERGYHWRWRASMADPRRYGNRTEISGPGGGPIEVDEVKRPKLTKAEWLAAHGVGTPARPAE